MTVTKPHAQMLATLAAASRPNGARRWDHAGIMAALAKVAERDLGEVIIATIRAAADRDCETPGVIPSAGSHWQQAAAVKVHVVEHVDHSTRCSTCSEPKDRHDRLWGSEHPFETVAQATAARLARKPETVVRTVAALKAEVVPTAPTPEPQGLDALAERRPELIEAASRIARANPGLRADATQVAASEVGG